MVTPWTYFLNLSVTSVILTDSYTRSPVHILMLSIQAVHGLPRLRAPGIVLCIISVSRQLPCFLMTTVLLASMHRLKRYRKKSVQTDLANGRIGAAHTPLHSPYNSAFDCGAWVLSPFISVPNSSNMQCTQKCSDVVSVSRQCRELTTSRLGLGLFHVIGGTHRQVTDC